MPTLKNGWRVWGAFTLLVWAGGLQVTLGIVADALRLYPYRPVSGLIHFYLRQAHLWWLQRKFPEKFESQGAVKWAWKGRRKEEDGGEKERRGQGKEPS
jgi:hypothetical protein